MGIGIPKVDFHNLTVGCGLVKPVSTKELLPFIGLWDITMGMFTVPSESSLVRRPFWEGETAWQLPRVQTVTSAARELEDPIRFQITVT